MVLSWGVSPPFGETLCEQRPFIARDDTLRNFVLNEPRGGVFRYVNLLVPPALMVSLTNLLMIFPTTSKFVDIGYNITLTCFSSFLHTQIVDLILNLINKILFVSNIRNERSATW